MIRPVQRFLVAASLACTGCASDTSFSTAPTTQPTRTTLLVTGVFGDGPWYDGLRRAAAENGSAVRTIAWGLPKPLFVGNFSSTGVHADAETKLAAAIDATPGPVDLVGHSAGCGVILGALAKAHRDVGRVVLIAPSVSPEYDLRPALVHVAGIDVFYSGRDTLFLKWRCGTFGTYDNVKTPAAGFGGFVSDTDGLVTQHAYDPAWAALGNDGGHGGGTAARFAHVEIAPILAATSR